MPAATTEFVTVTVNLGEGQAEAFGFGRQMGVFETDVFSGRTQGPFFNIGEVNDAGLDSANAPKINKYATRVFAQENNVEQLLIGRRIPAAGTVAEQVWQFDDSGTSFVDQTTEFNDATAANWDVFPASPIVDDYAAIGFTERFGRLSLDNLGGTAGTVGTVTWEYLSGGVWSALSAVVDGTTGFTAGVADGQVVTWTVPTDWEPEALNGSAELFYVRAVVTAPYTVAPVYDQGFVAGDQDYTQAMDGIEAVAGGGWYGHTIDSRLQTDIEDVALWTSARQLQFWDQSGDPDIKNAVPGNTFLALEASGYVRTLSTFYEDDDEYAAGSALSRFLGFQTDSPGGMGVAFGKALIGPAFTEITGAEAKNVYDANGNIYGRNKGLSFFSKGTMASGRFADITLTIDWIRARIEEAIISLFVSTPTKIPFTNGGINQCVAAAMGPFGVGVQAGHFRDDGELGAPYATVPDLSEISKDDYEARLFSFVVSAELAGAIQQLDITVNLQF